MSVGRPQPFFASALANQDKADFEDAEILAQVCMVLHKHNLHLIFFSDSAYMARVAFGDDVDIEQFSENTMVVLKSFAINKKSNGVISMELRDWDVVGKAAALYGPPKKLLPVGQPSGDQSNGSAGTTPQPEVKKDAPTTRSTETHAPNGALLVTVEAISPFISRNWQVQVRATRKSDVREFTRNGNVGKVFNITFTDETGEIQATGFNDDAVTKLYDQVVEGQSYNISKFEVRAANKQFNKTGHEYELIFGRDSVVEFVPNADVKLPAVYFRFVPNFAALPNVEVDSNIDVVGVAKDVGSPQSLTSRAGIPYTKRDIILVDDSLREITLTLWGADAEGFDAPPGTVIAAKAVRLSSFKGLSLSATRAAHIYTDPDDQRAHQLKGWYQATGGAGQHFEKVAEDPVSSSSGDSREERRRTTIADAIEQRLGYSEESDFFSVKARISVVNQRTVAYPSCTNGDCRKKVVEDGGQWRCEKCQVYMDSPRYRFMLSLIIDDASSPQMGLQVSVFDEIGRQLYGDTAQELQEMKGFGAPSDFNRELAAKLGTVKGNEYMWDIRGTLEHYNGEERPRFSAMRMKKIDEVKESLRMLSEMGA